MSNHNEEKLKEAINQAASKPSYNAFASCPPDGARLLAMPGITTGTGVGLPVRTPVGSDRPGAAQMIALAMFLGWLAVCAVAAIGPRRCIVWLVLAPLIRRNLRLRAAGLLPDEWYWADRIACRWGYFVDSDPNPLFFGRIGRFDDH